MRVLLPIALTGCFIKPDPPGIAGPDGGGGDGGGDSPPSRANYAFVSSGVIDLVLSDGVTNLKHGDDLCNTNASHATPPLAGRYVAWLSDRPPGPSASDRLRQHNAAGWILPDGEPFANTVDDIESLNLLNPLHIDENGTDVSVTTNLPVVATGTGANGAAVLNQDASCSTNKIEVGDPSVVDASWTDIGYDPCNVAVNLRVYCFGIDFNVHVP
jgi:hypothetical protein